MNERELYEQTCPSRNKWDGGRYDVAADQMAWEAWQARARIAEQREAELVRGLEAIRDYGDSSGRLGIYPEEHEAKYPEFAGDMEEAEIADAVLTTHESKNARSGGQRS